MDLQLFQVDAFTDRLFAGNPAGVCPLEAWLPDATMQAIAAENNLSETAFFVRAGSDYELRWFTPTCEVDLCGHATLASGFIVMDRLLTGAGSVRFLSKSGPLVVTREGGRYALDLPARPPLPCSSRAAVADALGGQPDEVHAATSYLAVFAHEGDVAALAPDMERVAGLDKDGVIATAPGRDVDFVSRYFAPAAGIPEDPVTGAAHCTLAPYWARRLGKRKLSARQISRRGGEVWCEDRGERVTVAGHAALYLEGRIHV